MSAEPKMDWAREARTGLPEAVLAEPKTPGQIAAIVAAAAAQGRRLLLTRLDAEKLAALPEALRTRIDHDPLSRTGILGPLPPAGPARIGIVTGGLADLPAATECLRTLAFSGVAAELIADVGVAGLHRLLDRIERIRRAEVVIAVAGMEGALFSVLAGLVAAPVVALPVSVGQGVGAGGRVALHAALASCAPGLVAVNIDNGFGAAQAALRILNAVTRRDA